MVARSFEGTTGNDTIASAIDGLPGVYAGLDGDDILQSTQSADTLLGGAGDDTLSATSSAALLDGGAGSDTLVFGSNDQAPTVATGGAATDTFVLRANSSGATITDFTCGSGGDRLDLSEWLAYARNDGGGNPFSQGHFALFQSGADTVVRWFWEGDKGGSEQDVLVLKGTWAADFVADNFVGGWQPDGSAIAPVVRTPSAAADSIDGGWGDDTLGGAAGADTLAGGRGDDVLDGGADGDRLAGGAGDDTLDGGAGDDTLVADGGSDQLSGGAGNDVLHVVQTEGQHVTLTGGDGTDTFSFDYRIQGGQQGAEWIVTDFQAGDGGDRIDLTPFLNMLADVRPVPGNPFDMAGGYLRLLQQGGDTLLQFAPSGVANGQFETVLTLRGVSATALTAANFGGASVDGAPMAPLAFVGTPGADTLAGTGYADSITGGAGDDRIDGMAGADTLVGGDGNDTLAGGPGKGMLDGGAGDDLLIQDHTHVGANTMLGGDGNDTLVCDPGFSDGAVTADGGAGDDLFTLAVNGSQAAVLLTGGTGSDTYRLLHTYPGNAPAAVVTDFDPTADRVDLSAAMNELDERATGANPFASGHLRLTQVGADTHLERTSWAGQSTLLILKDTALASLTSVNFGGIDPHGTPVTGVQRVGTAGADQLQGTDFADTLSGNGGGDRLEGNGGADVLTGSDDAGDVLLGGGGSDTLSGGGGNDLLSDAAMPIEESTGSAQLAGSDSLAGGAGNDTLYGGGDVGNDTLDGGAGNDLLVLRRAATGTVQIGRGGDGDDTIVVGNPAVGHWQDAGAISVSGGAGSDTFRLADRNAAEVVTITDFTVGTGGDKLDLLDYLDTLAAAGEYDGGNPFAHGLLQLVQSGSDTLLTVTTASGFPTTIARLANVTAANLTAANFAGGYAPGMAHVAGATASGTDGDDVIGGTVFDDALDGGAGDDVLLGRGARDTLHGGTGADTLSGTGTLFGDSGNDVLLIDRSAGPLPQVADGGDGDDVFVIDRQDGAGTTLTGGAGSDIFRIMPSKELFPPVGTAVTIADFQAGPGGDKLDLYELLKKSGPFDGEPGLFAHGHVRLEQDGADTVLHWYQARAGLGYPEIAVRLAGVNAASLTAANFVGGIDPEGSAVPGVAIMLGAAASGADGTAFDDTIVGGAGAERISGLGGNDVLTGAVGDTLIGGAGADTFVLRDSGVMLEDAGKDDTVRIEYSTAYYKPDLGVGKVEVGLSTGMTLEANNQGWLQGNTGADTLLGWSHGDTLDGGAGADRLEGRGGDDVYVVDNAGDVVVEAADGGQSDVVHTTLDRYTLAANVEQLVYVGSARFDGTGNELDNRLTGGALGDTLHGGGGNDVLSGAGGNDVLDGGAGTDTVVLAGERSDYAVTRPNAIDIVLTHRVSGTEVIVRNAERFLFDSQVYTRSDLLTGMITDYDDTLIGSDADDTLDGGLGPDAMLGGAGDDLYVVDDAGDVITELYGHDAVRVKLASGAVQLAFGVEDGILAEGAFNAVLVGNELDNRLTGNALDNSIEGGAGSDTLDGGAGADTMVGGAGWDTYFVDSADDVVIETGSEYDQVIATTASYVMQAGVEGLIYRGNGPFVGTGNDESNHFAAEGTGDLVFDGRGGADSVSVDGKLADFEIARPNATDLVLIREGQTLTLRNVETLIVGGTQYSVTWIHATRPSAFDDDISGTDGNDMMDGLAGADTMAGGKGDDTYVVDNLKDAVIEREGGGHDTVLLNVGAGNDTAGSYWLVEMVEDLIMSDKAAPKLSSVTGNYQDNYIRGNQYANWIDASLGNDTLDGGGGADTLYGGSGDDVYRIDNAGVVVREDQNSGYDTVVTKLAAYTLQADVEDLRYQGNTSFTGTGNGLANVITGGIGNDTVDGAGGIDTYVAVGAFADYKRARPNKTDLVLSNGTQTITLSNIEKVQFSDGVKTLAELYENVASEGNDKLTGSDGNDSLNGLTGNDELRGGKGDDIYVVDNPADMIVELTGEGHDTVQVAFRASGTYVLASDVEDAVVTAPAALAVGLAGNEGANTLTGNDGANTLSGNGGNDSLSGGKGSDVLSGGAGDDLLDGGEGADKLAGGDGNDTYLVDAAGDTVTEAKGRQRHGQHDAGRVHAGRGRRKTDLYGYQRVCRHRQCRRQRDIRRCGQ